MLGIVVLGGMLGGFELVVEEVGLEMGLEDSELVLVDDVEL